MNAATRGRSRNIRNAHTCKQAPITRAIRAALTASITVLALAGSGVAFAGDCTYDPVANTWSCNGDFTDTLPGGIFAPAVDMTLILGDSAPTSVIPGFGLVGMDASWGGDVSVISGADITTDGADGVYQYGSTSATLTNSGSINTSVTAYGANAVDISAYGAVSVTNSGDLSATGTGAYDVTTVSATSINGTVNFTNTDTGTITATAGDGNAIALQVSAQTAIVFNYGAIAARSDNGIAIGLDVQGNADFGFNFGSIEATSTNSQAVGLIMNGYANANALNFGSITVSSGGDMAIGMEAYATYASHVDNFGSITVSAANGSATGAISKSAFADAGFNNVNGANLEVTSTNGDAVGALAYSAYGIAYVKNDGNTSISVTADGAGNATGIQAYSQRFAEVYTSGDVIALTTSADGGTAIGISVQGFEHGGAYVNNDGNIQAISYADVFGVDGTATGILAQTYKHDVGVVNSGSVETRAHGYNRAIGIDAMTTWTDNAYVINTGSISANAEVARAIGIQAQSLYGSVRVTSEGDISVLSTGTDRGPSNYGYGNVLLRDYAIGIIASSGGLTTVINTGPITANGSFLAQGIVASADDGGVVISNSGTITAVGDQYATGIGTGHDGGQRSGRFLDNVTRNAVIDNAGDLNISITGDDCDDCVTRVSGISATLNFGYDVSVYNSGDIHLDIAKTSAYQTWADGIVARTYRGNASVVNSGDIVMSSDSGNGYLRSDGINASSIFDEVTVANSGNISMTASTSRNSTQYGIRGYSRTENAAITNAGDINVEAALAVGIKAYSLAGSTLGLGGTSINNSGDIAATGYLRAYGLLNRSTVGSGAITNSGDINVVAQRDAAIGVLGGYANFFVRTADMAFDNSGEIHATLDSRELLNNPYHSGRAYGVSLISRGGTAIVENSGVIDAQLYRDPTTPDTYYSGAAGLVVIDKATFAGGGDMTVSNSGSISAAATSNNYISDVGVLFFGSSGRFFHIAGAGSAVGLFAAGTYGNVRVTNSGAISSAAQADASAVDGATAASGLAVFAYGGAEIVGQIVQLGDISLTNSASGSISATATSNYEGSVTATGVFTADIILGMAYVAAPSYSIIFDNAGSVSATASIGGDNADGSATATGISVVNNSIVAVNNTGMIVASATSPADANATGLFASSNALAVTLGEAGYIGATATGASGSATGVFLENLGTDPWATTNAGVINAIFTGGGTAAGGLVTSGGDIVFTNSGLMFATASGDAIGVQLDSLTATTLTNSGTISAVSTSGSGIAVRTGDSTDTIFNTGTINGALVTGAGDDRLDNGVGSVWRASGTSDFGSGSDAISNAGRIDLVDATIDLGAGEAFGNAFTNSGAVTVSGDNRIVMGRRPVARWFNTPVTSTFVNAGMLDFRNGSANDSLTIVGSFGGNGVINLDVSGRNGTSDQLFIDGNVLRDSVNVINVNLVDLPTSTSAMNVAMVRVSGLSWSTSFTLGQVFYDPNGSFMTLDFRLASSISKTNFTDDVFSLGITQAAASVVAPVPSVPASSKDDRIVVATVDPVAGAVRDGRSGKTFDDAPTSNVEGRLSKDIAPATLRTGIAAPALSATAESAEPEIAVVMTGLSDSGTLAASIAPGVQNLMQSQIGTWRQRMGVIDRISKSGIGVWARFFQGDGTVNPEHTADNFGQGGNFAYDQRNSGTELGVDVGIADDVSIGLMLAKSEGLQSLSGAGAGSSRLDGDTIGGYATWVSPLGFYVDASYRRMSFDAKLRTNSGEIRTSGDASALNVEAGYAWTLDSGLKIEPQVQYTRTDVDSIDTLPGALASFQSSGGDSSRGRVGVAVRRTFDSSSAAWTPYLTLSAVREFDGDNGYRINDDFSGTTSVKGTSALVEAGLDVKVGGLSVFGGVNWQDGSALESVVGGQLGLRYAW